MEDSVLEAAQGPALGAQRRGSGRRGAGSRAPLIVAADWSGALHHEDRTLRVAVVDGDVVQHVHRATRTAAGALLLDAAERDPDLVVGLDFSFSMPHWWLDACGIGAVDELWTDGARLERWLSACEPPFWGRPGRRRPATWPGDPLRLTERCAPGHPASVFQVGGAGAVGTASLRGMPTLARLRAEGFAIWPFDPWRPPVIAEVWPRLAIGAVVKSRPAARRAWVQSHREQLAPGVEDEVVASPDALDACAAALWLQRCVGSGEAGRWLEGPAGADPVIAREGWIAGVTPRSRQAGSLGEDGP